MIYISVDNSTTKKLDTCWGHFLEEKAVFSLKIGEQSTLSNVPNLLSKQKSFYKPTIRYHLLLTIL